MKDKTKLKQTKIGMIPEGWKVARLGSCCKLVKKQFKPSKEDRRKYIGLEHIEQQSLRLVEIGSSEHIESNKFEFKQGQILFGKLRPYFRKVYRPKFDGVCSTDIWVIDTREPNDSAFFFYFFADNRIITEANNSSEGTRMPRARWDYLEELEFPIPLLPEQQKIAKILSDLDSKIELNQNMNKTLEAIGQAIFKHWFVDFEFPNEEGKPYKSSGGKMVYSEELGEEMPEGWEIKKLDEISDNFDSRRIPLSSRERDSRKGSFPYYGATSILDHVDDFIFDGTYVLMGEDGSVIDERGYPILQYVWGKFWVNNHAHVLRGKNISNELLYVFLKNTNVGHIVTGAVQPKINQNNMNKLQFTIPKPKTLLRIQSILNSLFEKRKINFEEINNLSLIRNSLLPKLMSGKIRVPIEAN